MPKPKLFTLTEARETTPPVDPVEAMRRQLALAVYDKVKESDIGELVEVLKAQAMKGDLKAMKMFFDLTIGKQQGTPAPKPSEDGQGLKAMADALQNLVDEICISKAQEHKRQTDPLLINSDKKDGE